MSILGWIFGRPLASREEREQRVGPVAGIPMLGLDALGSAAYGPEAAVTLLIPMGAAGIGYIVPISAVIAIVNLRGVRESGVAFIAPTYLFVSCLFIVIAIGAVKTWSSGGRPVPVAAPPLVPAATAAAGAWLLLRAFASSWPVIGTSISSTTNARRC